MAKTNSRVNQEKNINVFSTWELKKRQAQVLYEFVTINTNLCVLKQVDAFVREK